MEKRHQAIFDIYETGKISLERYLQFILSYDKKKPRFSKKTFIKFMFSQSKAYPQMIRLLKDLKSQYKLKIIAVSNDGKEISNFRIEKFKLTSCIDFFMCSGFVHLRKPDIGIWQMALDISQVQANEVLYIEDRTMFVELARNLGIKSILHTDFDSTRNQLASYGLI